MRDGKRQGQARDYRRGEPRPHLSAQKHHQQPQLTKVPSYSATTDTNEHSLRPNSQQLPSHHISPFPRAILRYPGGKYLDKVEQIQLGRGLALHDHSAAGPTLPENLSAGSTLLEDSLKTSWAQALPSV